MNGITIAKMQNMKLNYLTFLLICILSSVSFSQPEKSERAYQLLERCFNLTYSNPDSVLIYSLDIISAGQQLHDPILEAGGYAELGNAVRTKGQAEKSLIYYFKAISILGDSDKEKSKKASIYSAIGNAYYMMGDFNQATFNYQKSFQLKTEVKEWLSSAMVASQLVGIYAVQSKIDSAFVYARQGTNSITVDFDGNFGIVSVVETNSNGCEGLPVEVNVACNLSTTDFEALTIHVFPNPASENIYLNGIENLQEGIIFIRDAQGKIVFQISVADLNNQFISLQEFSSGFYYGTVETGKETFTFKFSKM